MYRDSSCFVTGMKRVVPFLALHLASMTNYDPLRLASSLAVALGRSKPLLILQEVSKTEGLSNFVRPWKSMIPLVDLSQDEVSITEDIRSACIKFGFFTSECLLPFLGLHGA